MRLRAAVGDDDALAGGEPVSLDRDRVAEVVGDLEADLGVGHRRPPPRRDPGGVHHLFREGLAAFQAGCCGARARASGCPRREGRRRPRPRAAPRGRSPQDPPARPSRARRGPRRRSPRPSAPLHHRRSQGCRERTECGALEASGQAPERGHARARRPRRRGHIATRRQSTAAVGSSPPGKGLSRVRSTAPGATPGHHPRLV